MSIYGWALVKSLILPPLVLVILVFLAMRYQKKRFSKTNKFLLAFITCLWLAATPLTSQLIFSLEETAPALTAEQISTTNAQAIIVLGGGMHSNAPEYGGETASIFSLARLRYGARLHRLTNLPVLITGAAPVIKNSKGEAQVMAETLEQDFGIAPRWVENRSLDTGDNARLSKEVLAKENINRILLVTQAWHMRRAAAVFRSQGFEVTPAPTLFQGYTGKYPLIYALIPSAEALRETYFAFHEFAGYIWYAIRY